MSLGLSVEGVALPHPCPCDAATMRAGVQKRFAFKTPNPDPLVVSRLRKFVRNFVRNNFQPLARDVDLSVEGWLQETNYPAYRKVELAKKWEQITDFDDKKHFRVKSFMKDEHYPEYKHARAINSRTDEFKCMVGPMFKRIEKEVFTLDWFIKKVPVKDRPQYVMDKVYSENGVYYATDHTAYEAHFTKELMQACEFELYDYMTKDLPEHDRFMYLLEEVIAGRNQCIFKYFDVEVDATRMSGEMNTSLGNGFSNLMFFLFMCEENGCTDVRGVVEGDDGLFSLQGKAPTVDQAARTGLTLKIEEHLSISTAGFCGIVFDENDRRNLTNPLTELVNFGWCTGKYANSKYSRHMELLRSKSLSLAYQYPGCPILASLARAGLRLTAGYKAQLKFFTNMWEREQFLEALEHCRNGIDMTPVGMGSRFLVERLYGITVEDQIRTEEFLDNLTELGELKLPWLHWYFDNMHPHWVHYYHNFSLLAPKRKVPSQFTHSWMSPQL